MDAGDGRPPGVAKAMTPKTSTLKTHDSGTHAREHASARKGSTGGHGSTRTGSDPEMSRSLPETHNKLRLAHVTSVQLSHVKHGCKQAEGASLRQPRVSLLPSYMLL